MDVQLQPQTEAGRRFVALAEEHAADFATRAEEHDRERSFPSENIEAMQRSGFAAALVPGEYGGLGVTTMHDFMVGMSRLGRGCASTAIAINMHLAACWVMTRIWHWREQTGAPAQVTGAVEAFMRAIGAGQMITCVPATEAGTDLNSPMTEATAGEAGYFIRGRKMFGTLSPAAQLMFVTVRVAGENGDYRRGMAIIPSAAKGVDNKGNWDALGMRASGSHDIVFQDVVVPEAMMLLEGEPWGMMTGAAADMASTINGALVACFLGMAESARDIAVDGVTSRKKGPRGKRLAERIPIQQLIAENEIDLEVMRAVTLRYAGIADAYLAQFGPNMAPDEEAYALQKQQQCMKWTVQRNAINIVDRALTLSGGAGYMQKHPLARLYRDVRAGPFMQPFAPYEALEFIGKVTLGLDPEIDR